MAGGNAHASYDASYVHSGMHGKAVYCVQYGMRQVGLGTASDVVATGGICGPRTDNAVRELQRRAGLQGDGVLRRDTGETTFQAIARDQPANAYDCWKYIPTRGRYLSGYGV